jgi:hypothetical protein
VSRGRIELRGDGTFIVVKAARMRDRALNRIRFRTPFDSY